MKYVRACVFVLHTYTFVYSLLYNMLFCTFVVVGAEGEYTCVLSMSS